MSDEHERNGDGNRPESQTRGGSAPGSPARFKARAKPCSSAPTSGDVIWLIVVGIVLGPVLGFVSRESESDPK